MVLLAAVLIGSLFQRITGLGLGLVAGPVLSFMVGPVAGVTMVNGLSIINAANNAWSVREKTDWRRFRLLAGGLVVGSLPALLVVYFLSGPWLMITIGGLVLLALAVASFNPEQSRISPKAKVPMLIAGVVGGFMSTIAGIAGPALTVYARLTGWDHRDFIATLHPVILVANTVSFVLKVVLIGGLDFGAVPGWLWVVSIVAIFVGAWLGDILNRKVSTNQARQLANLLAAAGAIGVLARGVMELV